MGTYVSLGSVNVQYSNVIFRSKNNPADFKEGQLIELSVEPTEGSVLSLEPSPDSPFAIINTMKSTGYTSDKS